MVAEMMERERTARAPSAVGLPTVSWLTDLVRLEIALWERVNVRLRADYGITLGQFESLWVLARSDDGAMRVGELAQALRITVGGASKIADRLVAAGLVRRRPDPADGRASVLTLTAKGRRAEAAATLGYEDELSDALDVLEPAEREHMHTMVRRLIAAGE